MKKIFTSIAVLVLLSGGAIQAQEFTVPQAEIIVPIGGEAERLENMFEVTWGYYGLVENAGNITCTLTTPSGKVMSVNGKIADANREGTQAGPVPTTENNALMFRGFMTLNEETMQYDQEYGTYKVNIPKGIVLVNDVPNPEENLEFRITGGDETEYMPKAEMVYPASAFTSYASAIQMYWADQNISFVDDVESVSLDADLDGTTVGCTASIKQVEGGNEDGTGHFEMDVLFISFDDFLLYSDGTNLTVYIPAGLVQNTEGVVNQSQDVELFLYPQAAGTLSPEPNTTLNAADALVTVTWEGISLEQLQGNTVVARMITLEDVGDDYTVPVTFGEDASITLNLTKLGNGTYEIIIPEGFVKIITEKGMVEDSYAINSEIVEIYTISGATGVEGLATEDGTYTVYSIDGKLLVSGADAAAVNALGKGLFIINGKKTLIR